MFGDQARADRDHVRVVVLPREPCRLVTPAERAPDTAHAIGGHRLAVARTTKDNAAFAAAAGDRFGGWTDEVRIIHGLIRERSKIFQLVTERSQTIIEHRLVPESCVI